jgi:hypothetical protein
METDGEILTCETSMDFNILSSKGSNQFGTGLAETCIDRPILRRDASSENDSKTSLFPGIHSIMETNCEALLRSKLQ